MEYIFSTDLNATLIIDDTCLDLFVILFWFSDLFIILPVPHSLYNLKIYFNVLIKAPSTTYQLEWPKSRTLITPNTGQDVEQQELSFIAGGNAKWYSHFGRQFGSFLQN